jgi:mono/diheme cytochrome c family protein
MLKFLAVSGTDGMRPRKMLMAAILVVLPTLYEGSRAEPVQADAATGLSDLMNRLQLQHAKLWFAGKFSNWGLASYEIQKIEGSLQATSKLLPVRVQEERTKEQIVALRQAVASKDVSSFTKAYSALTNECNNCHRGSGYGAITIQVPVTPPVSNQLFVDQIREGQALSRASCGACHVISDTAKETPESRARAPGFPEITSRPSFSADDVRQFLMSNHRRLGPAQAMPNPRLAEYQIEAIVAYLETLRADKVH